MIRTAFGGEEIDWTGEIEGLKSGFNPLRSNRVQAQEAIGKTVKPIRHRQGQVQLIGGNVTRDRDVSARGFGREFLLVICRIVPSQPFRMISERYCPPTS